MCGVDGITSNNVGQPVAVWAPIDSAVPTRSVLSIIAGFCLRPAPTFVTVRTRAATGSFPHDRPECHAEGPFQRVRRFQAELKRRKVGWGQAPTK